MKIYTLLFYSVSNINPPFIRAFKTKEEAEIFRDGFVDTNALEIVAQNFEEEEEGLSEMICITQKKLKYVLIIEQQEI